MAVTIKDVAALAGVSPSTVSRVCNDTASIARETREKVISAMEQLGYEPPSASGTSAASFRHLGIILPPSVSDAYENPFYLTAIRGASQFCASRQASCMIITGRDDSEILDSVRSLHTARQVDGFILMYSKKADPVEDYLCEQGVLYVIIGKPHQFAGHTICVDNDNIMAGRDAADYMCALGHRRIAFLSPDAERTFSDERRSGYQLSLIHNGLHLEPDYCVALGYDMTPLHSLLTRADRPTALIVSDDILGVAVERVCTQMNLAIPEDLSIISFNNSVMARLASPQLTSVDINSFQLGYEAASQIINHLETPNLMAARIIVPHSIVERDSCRRIDDH